VGAFSVYREGLDREAIKAAIDILNQARRPLVIFPEGMVSRTNDRLGNLMEGTELIARKAAKERATATPSGKVVVHPVAIRYFFDGELIASVTPVLEEIEKRLSWGSQRELPLLERIGKVGQALLALKEMEYLGAAQPGSVPDRLARLIDHLLRPLEDEWLKGPPEAEVVGRVKRLRVAILPEMVSGEITEAERARRWKQLGDLYLAQQLSCYPPDYISSRPSAERILETVERFEEDLTDAARTHFPLRVVVEVGTAIEVKPDRERGTGADPLMQTLREHLEAMLERQVQSPNLEPVNLQPSPPATM
jgi:hypothetical protein